MNAALLHIRDLQMEVLDRTLNDREITQELTEATQRIEDLTNCIECIANRSEYFIFESAIKELNQSFLAALNSHYRQSFSGQRLALELWFAGIQFSTNDLNFRKWKTNEKDIVWSSLINPDDGILSIGFARAYWPATEKRVHLYRNIAEKIYRECSQFVHGNSQTHDFLPKTFGYSKDVIITWKSHLDTITSLFLYTFLIRFNENLTALNYEKIGPQITEILGHISETRELITTGRR
jgi:hypothetical protein